MSEASSGGAAGDSCSISAPGWEVKCRAEWDEIISAMTCSACGTRLTPHGRWDGVRPPYLRCGKPGCQNRYKVIVPTRGGVV